MPDDDLLVLKYIPLTQAALWDRNPKLHDKEGIKVAIARYGFKDPPKYEPSLNGGAGGLAEGNGRLICLREMKAAGMSAPPRDPGFGRWNLGTPYSFWS